MEDERIIALLEEIFRELRKVNNHLSGIYQETDGLNKRVDSMDRTLQALWKHV